MLHDGPIIAGRYPSVPIRYYTHCPLCNQRADGDGKTLNYLYCADWVTSSATGNLFFWHIALTRIGRLRLQYPVERT